MINDVYKEGQFRKCQNSVVKQDNCKGSKITVSKSCSSNLTLEMFLNTKDSLTVAQATLSPFLTQK